MLGQMEIKENNAMGTKMSIPMPASYTRAIDRMNSHSLSLFITGFQEPAIYTNDNQHVKVRVGLHTIEILKPLMHKESNYRHLKRMIQHMKDQITNYNKYIVLEEKRTHRYNSPSSRNEC
jgi:translation elongation factor EF-4